MCVLPVAAFVKDIYYPDGPLRKKFAEPRAKPRDRCSEGSMTSLELFAEWGQGTFPEGPRLLSSSQRGPGHLNTGLPISKLKH